MSTQKRFNRFAGIVAILAGLLLLGAEVVFVFFGSENASSIATADRISGYLFLSGALCLTFTAVALFVAHMKNGGWITALVFFIAFLGSALMVTSDWLEVFGLPFLTEQGISEPAGSLVTGFMINFMTYALGWMLAGLLMLWSKRIPRVASISLILGIILVFVLGDLAVEHRIFDLVCWFPWYGSYILMGWSMLSDQHQEEEQIPMVRITPPATV